MRPRVFPADNLKPRRMKMRVSLASMRPRVFPADNNRYQLTRCISGIASMRPRVFPADNSAVRWIRLAICWSFNEAAGIPRG